MAVSEVTAASETYTGSVRRWPITRLLDDERWLAFVLLLPTMVLLGLFIAYPFAKGVELSVTDAKVGGPGNFVGMQNFVVLLNDSIFRVAVWNTVVYTAVTTVFKLALGLWLALLLNRNFKGKALTRAFILLPFRYSMTIACSPGSDAGAPRSRNSKGMAQRVRTIISLKSSM